MNANQLASHPTANFYQAIGLINGVIEVEGKQRTILIAGEKYKIEVARCVRASLESGKSAFLKVYPRVSAEGELTFFALYFINPEDRKVNTEEYSAFLEEENQFTLRGCWEKREGFPRFVIYRNQITNQKSSEGELPQTVLSLDWQNAPPADGSFWELKANLKDGLFSVTQVIGAGDPPPFFTPVIVGRVSAVPKASPKDLDGNKLSFSQSHSKKKRSLLLIKN